MSKLKKEVVRYNGTEWNVFSGATGEIPNTSSNDEKNIIHQIINVEKYYHEEDDDNEEESDFNIDCTFIRDFRGNGRLFRALLEPVEICVLEFLADYMCYGDCLLRKNGNKKGNLMTVSTLADDYGISRDSFKKIMTSLRKKQVIELHDKNTVISSHKGIIDKRCISFNPYIKCRGRKVDDFMIDYYSSTLWAEIKRQKIKVYDKKQKENI